MTKSKISLIISVLNEAQTIKVLLQAIANQVTPPEEIIVVDGGSTDTTVSLIQEFAQNLPSSSLPKLKFTLKILPNSNRSQARNWAINQAKHDLIAITDAGCVPQPSWLKHLLKKYQETKANIVGGYFYGLPATPFEQAVVAYTLQMPDQINPDQFMPTTRSVLLERSIWKKLGGFNEKLSLNEDFEFFYRARQKGVKFAFEKQALVGWLPRRNLTEFTQMIYRFAQGDIQAGIIRPKVTLLFGRYLLALATILILIFFTNVDSTRLIIVILFWLAIYLSWAIQKNLKYVSQGWYWLPVLQIVADMAVMTGSLMGLRRLRQE